MRNGRKQRWNCGGFVKEKARLSCGLGLKEGQTDKSTGVDTFF